MRVDGALVVMHGAQVYARGYDHRRGRLNASIWAAIFFNRISAGTEAGDGLYDGAAAGAFDKIEHEDFGCRNVVLEGKGVSIYKE